MKTWAVYTIHGTTAMYHEVTAELMVRFDGFGWVLFLNGDREVDSFFRPIRVKEV